jgi:hypothetical protein
MMASTIAVIPHGGFHSDSRVHQISVTALAATIASLLRHGVGRVVVVGHFPEDPVIAEEAFRQLRRYRRSTSTTTGMKDTDQEQQSSFEDELVYFHTDAIQARNCKTHIPKGALIDLQRALKGELSQEDQAKWLGSKHGQDGWKYVYFTEDDHILNARQLNGSHIRKLLDDGGVMIPHRLQPIPHALDLKGIPEEPTERAMLEESFGGGVKDLFPDTDSCCDTEERPGIDKNKFEGCGKFWWQCGFNSGKANHTRLESYETFRLMEGTGIVSLAANANSRKCIIFKNERGCQGR